MRRLARCVILVAILGSASGRAFAEPPELERAIAIGREAVLLYEQGRYAEAYERFAVADRMAHSIVFVLHMARSKRNMGQLVSARDLFERAAKDPLDPNATEPMRRAQAEAQQELSATQGRIPRLAVDVTGASPSEIRLTVDQKPVEQGSPLELDPGEHRVEAVAQGMGPAAQVVRLAEGSGVTRVTLVLRAPSPATPPEQARKGSIVPAVIAFGVGGAALGVGAVMGAVAAGQASDVESRCERDGDTLHCLASDREKGEDAGTFANISTVGFIVGGVAVATGIVLLWIRPGGSSAPPRSGAAMFVGPSSVGLAGRF